MRLVENPDLVTETHAAWGSAFWYWWKYVHGIPEVRQCAQMFIQIITYIFCCIRLRRESLATRRMQSMARLNAKGPTESKLSDALSGISKF